MTEARATAWLTILRRQAKTKGQAAVARELGVSPSTISMVLAGKYRASTEAIARRVQNIYGNGGLVQCPVLGAIEPSRCIDTWERARRIGVRAGNPATIRLHKACLKCDLRQ